MKVKQNFFVGDNFGNAYLVNGDELVKYLANGKFFARYSNLKLGDITLVDATNPLKLLLYYRDFQQIVFLDNQLSKNSEAVSLEQLGYEQTDLVCAGANNSFWLYNKQNNELIRFDENLKKVAATGNLKQILQNNLAPDFMLEHNGNLFLNCPETGVFVFDIFGAFSKMVAVKHLRQFQVNENIIYYQKDSAFCSYDYKLFEEACKLVPGSKPGMIAKYYNGKLYSGYKDSLLITPFK
ncbi:MAG: hypothetical protein V4635_08735 [Bacteroidota bacterium]